MINFLSKYDENQIAVVLQGEEPTTFATVSNAERSYTATGLELLTSYDVYVRGIIQNEETEEYSDWSEVFTFTTTDYPTIAAPSDLTSDVSNYPDDGTVILSWTPEEGQVSWTVNYRLSSATEWMSVAGLEECSLVLSDLQENSTYIWRVNAATEFGTTTAWSAQAQFETSTVSSVEKLDSKNISVNLKNETLTVNGEGITEVIVSDMAGHVVAHSTQGGNINVPAAQTLIVKVVANGYSKVFKVR